MMNLTLTKIVREAAVLLIGLGVVLFVDIILEASGSPPAIRLIVAIVIILRFEQLVSMVSQVLPTQTDADGDGSGGRWSMPDIPSIGPIQKSAIDYAFIAWVAYHIIELVDPVYFDVPFVAVAIFAIFGVAKGLDRALNADAEQSGGADAA